MAPYPRTCSSLSYSITRHAFFSLVSGHARWLAHGSGGLRMNQVVERFRVRVGMDGRGLCVVGLRDFLSGLWRAESDVGGLAEGV